MLALSATVNDARVFEVLGPNVAIWAIEAANPHNDVMRRRGDLAEFRRRIRSVFNDIKAFHGEHEVIHLFAAMPVSAAVEVGRAWMPKADLPLVLYDQNRRVKGFAPTFEING